MYRPRIVGCHPWKHKNLHTAIGQYSKRNKSTEIPQEEHGSRNIVGVDIVELCKEGRLKEAFHFLCINLPAIEVLPSVYASLLKGCIDAKALLEGKKVHTHMIKNGFQPRNFLQNRLLDMYAVCGSLDDARQVFDKMPYPDVFSWTDDEDQHGFRPFHIY
jgi:pentatricopeptide repeat protein